MIKSIFFDFDDTLIATKDISYKKHRIAAENLGLKIPSEKEFFSKYGVPWNKFLKSILPEVSVEKFLEEYFKHMEEYSEIDGAKETLEFLLSKEIFLGILSTRTLNSIQEHANRLFPSIFHSIHSCAEGYCKPDPRSFNQVIQVLLEKNISIKQTLFVGDSLHDFFAARDSGIEFVGVLTGYHSKEEFLENGLQKNKMISSVADLKEYLLKNNLIR